MDDPEPSSSAACPLATTLPHPPSVSVPMNFGIANLYKGYHNNVTFKMRDGKTMAANSMILAFNSKVFEDSYVGNEIYSVEIDDFSSEVVVGFLEALYGGTIDITMKIFREMFKISVVFRVDWIKSACVVTFRNTIEPAVEDGNLAGISTCFEEALYARKNLKEDTLIDAFSFTIQGSKSCGAFVEHQLTYLSDVLNGETLHCLLGLVDEDSEVIFAQALFDWFNHEDEGAIIDEISRYILVSLNWIHIKDIDQDLFESIFDVLLDNVHDFSKEDGLLVTKIYRACSRPKPASNQLSDETVEEVRPVEHESSAGSMSGRTSESSTDLYVPPHLRRHHSQ